MRSKASEVLDMPNKMMGNTHPKNYTTQKSSTSIQWKADNSRAD